MQRASRRKGGDRQADGAGRGLAEQPWHCAAGPLLRDRLRASGHKGGRGLLSCPSLATCWGGYTRPPGISNPISAQTAAQAAGD